MACYACNKRFTINLLALVTDSSRFYLYARSLKPGVGAQWNSGVGYSRGISSLGGQLNQVKEESNVQVSPDESGIELAVNLSQQGELQDDQDTFNRNGHISKQEDLRNSQNDIRDESRAMSEDLNKEKLIVKSNSAVKNHKDFQSIPSDRLHLFCGDKLSLQLWEHYQKTRQTESTLDQKMQLRSALLHAIKTVYKDASLHIVGSSTNGFGSEDSDIDFCAVVNNNREFTRRKTLYALSNLRAKLATLRYLKDVRLIPAVVPILEFQDCVSGFNCDISINNDTGIRNTHLLYAYSLCDDRVAPLVKFIKMWGHYHGINKSQYGTLSSYAVVNLVINYLQECDPPVLPFLQEDFPNIFRKKSSLNSIPKRSKSVDLSGIPQNLSKNQKTIGELLIGFYRHYAVFKWSNYIISIKKGKFPLDWRHKFMTAKAHYINIEEPFEDKNVARSIRSRKKYEKIKIAFNMGEKALRQNPDLKSLFSFSLNEN
ncbi:Poly(A) RNA polymerase GLD2 [Trichoplax sp. H2]|nr:Poly(A) RNA polymerase GLD2 [Trichoplax sp. H2]|eukprot:RDD37192.1 Poly(A) RNA polymerase GLD2 [Trichoplax sp. H2]